MPQTQDNVRILLLIVILFWLASNPDSGSGLVAGPASIKSRLARQRHAHGILNSTSRGDFAPRLADDPPDASSKYLNVTGFREEDDYAWEDLGRFKNACEELNNYAVGFPEVALPVWQNATGVVRGLWDRTNASTPRYHSSYNLSQITPDVTWNGWASDWDRNVTGAKGRMLLRVEDDENSPKEPEVLEHGILTWTEVKAREVAAILNIEDTHGSGNHWEMRLHGVHWPREGAMLFTTTSEKFAGIFVLPHLTTRPDFFESAQALLNRTLDQTLAKREQRAFLDQSADPWQSTLDEPNEVWNPTPHCEFLVYIQIFPPDKEVLQVEPALTGPENVVKAIAALEDELRFPMGKPHKATPKLQMSAVLFSPDCGFFLQTQGPPKYSRLEVDHLLGVKHEIFMYSVTTWLLGFALVIFGQVQLLKIQMRETSTPSTLGRVSFITMSVMLLADGIVFAATAGWSLSAETTLLPSLVVTCVSFLSMTIGTFFLSEIHKVQEPEWRRQERDRERQTANTPHPPSTPTPNSTATTNAPITRPALTVITSARPVSPPIIIPSDQDLDAEIAEVTNNSNNSNTLPAPATATTLTNNNENSGTPLSTIFSRYVLAGTCLLFLSIAAATWRPMLRSAFYNLLAFVYLSLWIPQIHRNVYRNCRRALSWQFVGGQSVLRLLPIAYFYVLPNNFAFAETDWMAFTVLIGWLWIQVWVLVAQSVLGPRYGVPKGWMPEAWDYHPILREDNVEAGGLPIGLVLAGSGSPSSPTSLDPVVKSNEEEDGKRNDTSSSSTNTHVIDCAICREVLEVPVVRSGSDDDPTTKGVAGVFARRMYMVTPCRHMFHSACLEGWMRFRLQCPICREELPPL